MVADADEIRHFRRIRAYRALFQPRAPQTTFDDGLALHDYAGEYLDLNSVVTYLEFGVSAGHTIRKWTARFINSGTRLIGFDSFQGLPEDWPVGAGRIIRKGDFSTGGVLPQIDDNRVSFVIGWFQNTVPAFFADPATSLAGKVLVHYDADLYSSTLFLLTYLWSHLPEYYFIMDDFFEDDIIALHDFTMAYPVELEWIAYHRTPANLPHKVLGKMKRTDFRLGDG
jgi:O-methyltransferase